MSNHVDFARATRLAFAAFLFSSLAFGQSDLGSITGYVKDPTGATIPNANVVVKNQDSGAERQAKTNDSGYYAVTNIQPGVYSVTADAAGFKKYEAQNNKLDPSSSLLVDATLTVGAASETVEVSATAAPLQTESSSVQKLISREQIDSIELNGRNPILLAQLQPGVRGGSLAGFTFSLTSGPSNINGSRTPENLVTFDGAPAVRTRSNGTSVGVADVDSTQEMQVLTADYAAEYGRSSGGQIRIISKTGGQQFHGALYEYFRNNDLNANSWSRNTNPATGFAQPQHYNQFGYNIGGPFYIPGKLNKDKNKYFWYWGQEWVKYHTVDLASQSVPTALMRTGNFSELLDPNNAFYKGGAKIYDPNTCPVAGAATCVAFPNNVIPASRLSPNGLALLRAFPTPNLANFINGRQNWFATGVHTFDQRKDTLSADINITDSQRLQFRRQNFALLEYQPLDGGSDRVPKFFNRPNQTNSLTYIWAVSPTVVNQVLLTASLDDVYIPVDLSSGLYDRTQYGINYPYLFPGGKQVPNRIPNVALSGGFYELNGGPYPSHSAGPIYDASDSLTWIKGNHTMKFGFLYEKSGENDFDQINVSGVPGGTSNQNGRFAFSDSRTGANATSGVGVANAALGLFDIYAEIGPRSYTIYRGSMYEWFAQDSWKVNQKLHIDYGVRHTIQVPYHALWGNEDVFDRRFYDPAKAVKQDPKTGYIIPGSGDQYNGLVIPGSGIPSSAKGRVNAFDQGDYSRLFHNLPNYYSQIHYGQFQPRVGLAYQVSQKTVIRAGIGRFFTRLGVSDSVFLGGNPPFQPIASVSNGSADNPGGGSANLFPFAATTQSLHFNNPEAWNWNFTVQRELFWNTVLEVAYVGRRGLHLQEESDINQLPEGTLTNPANAGINPDTLRPFKGYGVIRETDNVASSRYNSFQLNWTRRFTKGSSFGLAYTLSKSTDNGSNQRDIIPDAYDRSFLYGPSEFDNRHTVVINYIYELPFFRAQNTIPGKLLGGWSISGVTQFQTGTPCTVGTSNDFAGVGSLGSMCGIGQSWVVNGNPQYSGKFAANGAGDPNQWFTTTNSDGSPIFTKPTPGTFNKQHVRDLLYSPGFQNWNLYLFKTFAFSERTGLQFRADAFNFVNHPNWSGVDFNPTSGTFGKVTTKNSERNLQLSLRLFF